MNYKDYSKQLVDILQGQVYFENLIITKLETENIIKNDYLQADQEKFIIAQNIKNAWDFIFSTSDVNITPNYILHLHKILMKDLDYNNGNYRNTYITVQGSKYVPPLLINSQYEEMIKDCLNNSKDIYQLPLLIAREQFFNDGNKRTATMLLEKELIKQGKIFNLNMENGNECKKGLLKYYENLDDSLFVKMVKDNTIVLVKDNPKIIKNNKECEL